jgi:hypothetical protein
MAMTSVVASPIQEHDASSNALHLSTEPFQIHTTSSNLLTRNYGEAIAAVHGHVRTESLCADDLHRSHVISFFFLAHSFGRLHQRRLLLMHLIVLLLLLGLALILPPPFETQRILRVIVIASSSSYNFLSESSSEEDQPASWSSSGKECVSSIIGHAFSMR